MVREKENYFNQRDRKYFSEEDGKYSSFIVIVLTIQHHASFGAVSPNNRLDLLFLTTIDLCHHQAGRSSQHFSCLLAWARYRLSLTLSGLEIVILFIRPLTWLDRSDLTTSVSCLVFVQKLTSIVPSPARLMEVCITEMMMIMISGSQSYISAFRLQEFLQTLSKT